MKNKVKIFVLVFFLVLINGTAGANNLVIDDISLENLTASTVDVEFDISWENSWHTSGAPSITANWDAAWVFIKFSTHTRTYITSQCQARVYMCFPYLRENGH